MSDLTCDHCLLTFPERDAVREDINGRSHIFCCSGCRGVFLLIRNEGFEDFYLKRKWETPGLPAAQKKELDLGSFTEDVREADQTSNNEKEIDIYIDGIRCASCVWLNEKFLSRTKGVSYVRINFATHKAKIRWSPELISLGNILKKIQAIGYNPRPHRESEQFKLQKAEARDLLVRFGTAAFLSSQLMIYSIALYAGYFQGIDPQSKLLFEIIAMFLTLPVLLYSGMPFIINTLKGLRHLHFTMDSLITIGAGSAFVYSVYEIFTGGTVYFDTSAMIITLILLGRYIESTAKGKASETIEKLSELNPREARVLINAQNNAKDLFALEAELTPLQAVNKSDLIKVLPGERIPLDGIIVCGESEVDESIITGESKPLLKTPGREVIGGSVNLFGTLIFEVTQTGKDTILAGIIRSVEDAQARKPRLQMLADRVVGYFVPAILVIAFITTAGYLIKGSEIHAALMTGISVLVIACPCSLGLATPLAVLLFTAMASSKGILIRGGEVIENAGRTTQVIFDKTGTITEGKATLKETFVTDAEVGKDEVLRLAASLENLSEHSIGQAVTSAWKGSFYPVEGFLAKAGRGIEGTINGKRISMGNRSFMKENGLMLLTDKNPDVSVEEISLPFEKTGDTVIYLGWGDRVRALFIVSDCLRREAIDTVLMIHSLEKEVALVSGDNKTTTEAVASAAGIEHFLAETLPERKRTHIHELQEKGTRTMMVGDGINDAPALTEASVGVAMGKGTDIAMESADAVLVRNDLTLIPYFIGLSGRAYAVIKQNIFWAFFYNIVAIPLAVSGLLHPIIAAGAMAASSLFVVLNSLRIRNGVR